MARERAAALDADALNEPGTAAPAGEIIRNLIDRVVLTPPDGLFKAGVFGDLPSRR